MSLGGAWENSESIVSAGAIASEASWMTVSSGIGCNESSKRVGSGPIYHTSSAVGTLVSGVISMFVRPGFVRLSE